MAGVAKPQPIRQPLGSSRDPKRMAVDSNGTP